MKTFLLLASSIFIFTACSKVNVILLPEEGNKVGKIEIKNENKKYIVKKAYEQVNAIDGDASLLTEKEVQEKFKESIEALPKEPKSFLLYFEWDSAEVVLESKKTLKNIVNTIKNEDIHYVSIIGHSDTAGNAKYNKKLSLRRANNVKRLLLKQGVDENKLSVDYYGESAPLVKTKDNVPNKANRRVEILTK